MACNGFSVTFLAADFIWIVKVCVCGATRAPPPATCHSALFCSLKLVLDIDHRRVGHVGHSRPPRTGRRGQRFGSLFLYTHAMKARGKSLKRGCCRACLPACLPAGRLPRRAARPCPRPVMALRCSATATRSLHSLCSVTFSNCLHKLVV